MKILDLYSGTGIAAIGYHQEGFEVIGIDIEPKPRYPFKHIQADALEILKDIDYCRKFDAIHASPPCQAFTPATAQQRAKGKIYPNLIEATRRLLEETGMPWIMENVPNAPVRKDLILRGDMFGLNVWKTRVFELGGGFWMMQPSKPTRVGSVKDGDFVSIFGKGGYRKYSKMEVGWRPKCDKGSVVKTWHYAMGIPEEFGPFKDVEISEGIPPAYTRYIGEHLANHVNFKNR